MSGSHRTTGLAPIWPADRYEVLCEQQSEVGASIRDRYHSESFALAAAQRLAHSELTVRVRVLRLTDQMLVFDSTAVTPQN